MMCLSYDENYKKSKQIAKIRHNQTAYDNMDVFYNLFPWARRKLNWNCFLFSDDEISLVELTQVQEQISNEINLYKKCNQKRFLTQTMIELQNTYPDVSASFVKRTAKKILKHAIVRQEQRNQRRFANNRRIYIID